LLFCAHRLCILVRFTAARDRQLHLPLSHYPLSPANHLNSNSLLSISGREPSSNCLNKSCNTALHLRTGEFLKNPCHIVYFLRKLGLCHDDFSSIGRIPNYGASSHFYLQKKDIPHYLNIVLFLLWQQHSGCVLLPDCGPLSTIH
jgi:hypothetical protein